MQHLPDVLVLCGGLGTRLRSITGESPKSMVAIAGRPFLELLLRQLERYGFRRVILAVGYQSEMIRAHFGTSLGSLAIAYSEEHMPLGTAGAIRNALWLVESDPVLVANGDSYTDADLSVFVKRHLEESADASIMLVPADERSDCGTVMLDAAGHVTRFDEKRSISASRYINAGIYVLAKKLIETIPAGVQVSIEREVFPDWIARGASLKGYVHEGSCLDIGTPERLQSAQVMLSSAEVG